MSNPSYMQGIKPEIESQFWNKMQEEILMQINGNNDIVITVGGILANTWREINNQIKFGIHNPIFSQVVRKIFNE